MKVSKKSRSFENVLTLDISSGSVGAALIRHSKENLPEVVFDVRIPFYHQDPEDLARLEGIMLSSIDKGLELIVKHGLNELKQRSENTHINRMVLVFNSPWIYSRLQTVPRNFNLGKENDQFKKELNEKYDSESEVFETGIITQDSLEIHLLQTAVDERLVRKIEDKVLKHLSIKSGVSAQSFLFIFLKVLAALFQNLQSFSLVRMSEDQCDFLSIEKTKPIFMSSVPIGPWTLARELAEKLDIALPLALSHLSLFSKGMLDSETTERMEEIISKGEEKWKKTWVRALKNAPEIKKGQTIFVVSAEPYENISKILMQGIFRNNKVIVIGKENPFVSNTVRYISGEPDEATLITTSFSELLRG